MFAYQDSESVINYMNTLLEEKELLKFDSVAAAQYSVPELTKKLLNKFESLVPENE